MSRIDQALRIREVASGAAAPETGTNQSRGSSSLNQYPNEEPDRHPLEEPASPDSFESAQPFRPASTSRRTATRRAKLPDTADIQARLVTGALSTVSLAQYRRLAAVPHAAQVPTQPNTVLTTNA